MKVAIVDPSLFTWPYDVALCEAENRQGAEARVIGRHLNVAESPMAHPLLVQHYYPSLVRDSFRKLPRTAFLAAKGASHFFCNRRLVQWLKAFQPDVIHFQWLPLPLVDLASLNALKKIAPIVLTVHDTVPFNGSPRSRIQALGFRRALNCFDALVVHTEQGRQRMAHLVADPRRLHIIPHGLTAPAASVSNAAAPVEEAPTFLMFGKLKPYKGLDILIEAVASLKDTLPAACKFRIVGEPFMDLSPMLSRVRELGIESFLSFELRRVEEAEIEGLFRSASALVFPYREIEASGVLMNALEYGRPVIASRLGAFAEYLSDGEEGLLVTPEEPAELATAISRFLNEPHLSGRLTQGITARRHQLLDWDDVGRMTIDLYGDVCASGERQKLHPPPSVACYAKPTAPETSGALSD